MSLDAYRRGRLDEARVAAELRLAEVRSAADAELARAASEAAATLAEARADGTAEADREIAVARARERRQSQRTILGARRRAYDHLQAATVAATADLPLEPGYRALLDRLERWAREQLGEAALVRHGAAGGGGVVAEADGRRVDYSLAALAERCLREIGTEVEELWR